MTTREVAERLAGLASEGKFEQANRELYAADIVSMEAGAPPGGSRESRGMAAVDAKREWWAANHDIHSVRVDGPLVAGAHFTVAYTMDVTFKPQGRRFTMEEIGVYRVAGGKVVYEEFFYST